MATVAASIKCDHDVLESRKEEKQEFVITTFRQNVKHVLDRPLALVFALSLSHTLNVLLVACLLARSLTLALERLPTCLLDR